MARRGWVSAEVEPGVWRRLAVFDDGWVELPGFARGLSDTRRNLRRVLGLLVGFVALLAVAPTLAAIGVGGPLPGLATGVLVLVGISYVLVSLTRMDLRDLRQTSDDYAQAQARAERDAGSRVRRAHGAPLLRRAGSAQQLDDWLDGVRRVAAADIVDVEATRDGDDHVVTVRVADGRTRVLRSPDGTLLRLLLPLARRGA